MPWTHFFECPKASLLIRPSFAFVNIPVDVKTTSYQKPTSPHHNAARTNQPYSCTPSPPLGPYCILRRSPKRPLAPPGSLIPSFYCTRTPRALCDCEPSVPFSQPSFSPPTPPFHSCPPVHLHKRSSGCLAQRQRHFPPVARCLSSKLRTRARGRAPTACRAQQWRCPYSGRYVVRIQHVTHSCSALAGGTRAIDPREHVDHFPDDCAAALHIL